MTADGTSPLRRLTARVHDCRKQVIARDGPALELALRRIRARGCGSSIRERFASCDRPALAPRAFLTADGAFISRTPNWHQGHTQLAPGPQPVGEPRSWHQGHDQLVTAPLAGPRPSCLLPDLARGGGPAPPRGCCVTNPSRGDPGERIANVQGDHEHHEVGRRRELGAARRARLWALRPMRASASDESAHWCRLTGGLLPSTAGGPRLAHFTTAGGTRARGQRLRDVGGELKAVPVAACVVHS